MSAAMGERVRVGLELTALELSGTGTGRAIRDLRAALGELDGVEIEPLSHPASRFSGRFTRGLARELLYFPTQLPYLARTKDLDVLHCPSHLAPTRSPCPLVVTVNDVVAWREPATMSRSNLLHHKIVLRRALRRAAVVLTPSRFTRDELLDLFDLDPGRVEVAPYGVPAGFTPGQAPLERLVGLGIGTSYVLVVGTSPRKDVATSVAAFERFVAGGAHHHLVIVGPVEEDPRLPSIVAGSKAASRIHVLGQVSDRALVGLYRGACCLLHPSRYEGFGFPPLEAMACGVPVVGTRHGATAEVIGKAGLLVDPEDDDGFARALADLLGSPARRAHYSRRGLERAAGYSWRRCAEITASAYARAGEWVPAGAVLQPA
jgi:glycosyltransferase involved in cell wall biosynthesis